MHLETEQIPKRPNHWKHSLDNMKHNISSYFSKLKGICILNYKKKATENTRLNETKLNLTKVK